MRNIFEQFKKGSGEAPQYETLAPAKQASGVAKFVQSFDERAIMQEQPPTQDGGPRGSPKRDDLPTQARYPKLLLSFTEWSNMRADNQTLVREVPTARKADQDARPSRLRIYRDAAGEGL